MERITDDKKPIGEMVQPLWETLWWVVKNKHRIITGSSNSTSRSTHRRTETETWTDIYTPTLTVARRRRHPGVPGHMNGKIQWNIIQL